MAENSKIEWTHHTGNLWWGCTEVHAGCDNCYARVFSNRYNNGDANLWGKDAPRKSIKSVWGNFMRWQALAHAAGEVHRVFVGSMMDIFEKSMPVRDHDGKLLEITTGDLRLQFFCDVVENCPNLMFLLLTKRPSNIMKYIPPAWMNNPPKNVMYGTSPVDQATFDTLVPQLLKVPGRRFLSVEPQLDEVTFTADQAKGIDWIIQGGESGPGKRPFNLLWAAKLRKRCEEYKIPYFFKQIDKVEPIPPHYYCRQFPDYGE